MEISSTDDYFILQIGNHVDSSFSVYTNKLTKVNVNKLENQLKFQLFESSFSFQFTSYINNSKKQELLNKATIEYLNGVKSSQFSFAIDNQIYQNHSSTVHQFNESNKHQIQIFSKPNFINQICIGDPTQMNLAFAIHGNFTVSCVALSTTTLKEVFDFIVEDFHRSLLQRMDIMGENEKSKKKFIIPLRVQIYSDEIHPQIALCDYKLPDENNDDCLSRIHEIFGSFDAKPSDIICNDFPCKGKKKVFFYYINSY